MHWTLFAAGFLVAASPALGGAAKDPEQRAASAIQAARAPFETAAKQLLSTDSEAHDDAATFLVYSEEQSIRPLTTVPTGKLEPLSERQLIDVASAELILLTKSVKARLLRDLDDRRAIPNRVYPGPQPEEKAPPERVCDSAYLALRHLLHSTTGHESEIDYEVGAKAFLWRPSSAKDKLIQRFKQTGKWVQLSP